MEKQLPSISVYGLTGCAGELLVILENLEKLIPFVKVQSFPFAQSKNDKKSKCDIAFVEGSVSSKHDLELLSEIRENCSWLVGVGNCAVLGCVQTGICQKSSIEGVFVFFESGMFTISGLIKGIFFGDNEIPTESGL